MNPVIIKHTKKIQTNTTPNYKKQYNTEQGKIINKRKIQHTLMDSRFCSLTACLKNAKNTKGQSAICEGLEKYKKNTKIQIAFLDVMEKYKKNTKIQSVFYLYLFLFLQKQNTKKKYKKYQCNCSNIQNTKKIRINNFKNTKYKVKTNSKISQRANAVFTFGNQEPKYKKNIQNQPVVFSKPCSSDFVFLGCIFFVFFCIFEYW